MSAETPRTDVLGAASKPKRRQFVRSGALDRLAPDAAVRQGQVTTLALQAFGERGQVLTFLNTHDIGLGGRPLDIAISGASGLAAVAAVVADHARLGSSGSGPAVAAFVPSIEEPSETPDRGMATRVANSSAEEN